MGRIGMGNRANESVRSRIMERKEWDSTRELLMDLAHAPSDFDRIKGHIITGRLLEKCDLEEEYDESFTQAYCAGSILGLMNTLTSIEDELFPTLRSVIENRINDLNARTNNSFGGNDFIRIQELEWVRDQMTDYGEK